MVDLLITGGTVVTVDESRRVIENGAVAIDGGTIAAVGRTDEVTSDYAADRIIDAANHVVLPGLISSHVHVSDILLRGGIATDRSLYDWLFNAKFPGVYHMTPDEHAIAAALYCSEAIRSGITTIVENGVGAGGGYSSDIVEAKLNVYDDAGLRNVYGHSFVDKEIDPRVTEFIDVIIARESGINRPETQIVATETGLDDIAQLIERFHGTADGRQQVWPAPASPRTTTKEGLLGAYDIADEYDVMTTTHVSETTHDNAAVGGDHLSMVEYLHEIDFLGPRALLGHCVHLSDRDVRLLSRSHTKVAHNPLTNLALGSGVAPVPQLIDYGVTVGLGTDNTSGSDTINMINDLRFAAMLHKAVNADPTCITAEKALEMATIDNAHATGMADSIGSIEPGKQADLVLLDLDQPHMIPHPSVVSAVVYQAQGYEVDTVVCNGTVIMEDRVVAGIDERYPSLLEDAQEAAEEVIQRAGLTHLCDRSWRGARETG